MPTGARNRWLGFTTVALFGGVVAYTFLWPRPVPETLAEDSQLRCVAKSVALHQHVYAMMETGAPAPAYLDELEVRVNRLYRLVRSLTQSNDPRVQSYRPIMIQEEAARDAAVAADPEAYERQAWAEVQDCDTTMNGVLPA